MHCVQYRQNRSLDRSSMSERYQCQRRKKGYLPIRIRVIANQNVSSAPAPVEAAPVDPPPVDICTRRKSKRALSISMHLSHAQELKEMEEQKIPLENELKESRENNKLLEKELVSKKETLEESKKILKSAQNMLSQCRDWQSLTAKKKVLAVGDLVPLC